MRHLDCFVDTLIILFCADRFLIAHSRYSQYNKQVVVNAFYTLKPEIVTNMR